MEGGLLLSVGGRLFGIREGRGGRVGGSTVRRLAGGSTVRRLADEGEMKSNRRCTECANRTVPRRRGRFGEGGGAHRQRGHIANTNICRFPR